ncbi:MAG: hypothetical protein ABIS69_08280 [Sediminibacterium sp.]
MSDFIKVKKRNNRTLKTFFTGSLISCRTVYGNYISGIVRDVRNDSVFIKEFDIRSVPNQWGVSSVDTLGSFIVGIHYKDIETVVFPKRESFGFVKNGSLFIIGGLGYATLNLVNGKYLNESITSSDNLKSLGISLGVAGVGFLMNRLRKINNRNGKRYTVEYVRMNDPKKLKPF